MNNPIESKCACACHENKLNKQYIHDTACCENINGVLAQPTELENWEVEFALAVKNTPTGAILDSDYWIKKINSLLLSQKQSLITSLEGELLKAESVGEHTGCVFIADILELFNKQ